MALGRTPRQVDLLRSTVDYCQGRVAPDSIYGILHRECFGCRPSVSGQPYRLSLDPTPGARLTAAADREI
jgi:hypothetical protein